MIFNAAAVKSSFHKFY